MGVLLTQALGLGWLAGGVFEGIARYAPAIHIMERHFTTPPPDYAKEAALKKTPTPGPVHSEKMAARGLIAAGPVADERVNR